MYIHTHVYVHIAVSLAYLGDGSPRGAPQHEADGTEGANTYTCIQVHISTYIYIYIYVICICIYIYIVAYIRLYYDSVYVMLY